MAFRYRIRHVEDGDVIDTRDWNLNHGELAHEFNGHVDRDNAPESVIDSQHVVKGVMQQVVSVIPTAVARIITGKTTMWQNLDATEKQFTTEADSTVTVEWSGCWFWSNGGYNDRHVGFRITVDGREVALYPSSTSDREYDATCLVGTTIVGAGTHTVKVSGRTWEGSADRIDPEYVEVTEEELVIIVGAR